MKSKFTHKPKNAIYKNKEWLEENYCNRKLDANRISKICNVSKTTILDYLRKNNIVIRSKKEATHLGYMKKIGNNKYCDERWLKNKYINIKLSTYQIGKLCGVNNTTIINWLKIYNIAIRSTSESTHLIESNHCNLSHRAREWIDGELLGDGCLRSQSKYSARFVYGSKYFEYINYISNTLQSFGIEQAGKIIKRHRNNCYDYNYGSRDYIELLPIRERWYPDGKKIIPKDLKLTSLTCRQWYIGDGSLLYSKSAKPFICLATCGFLSEDVDWLIEQLTKLEFKVTKWSQNRISILAKSTKNFLNYIGKCPTDCYQYKWNL